MGTIETFLNELGTVNRYSLLSRMISDCEYFLGYGNRNSRLWGCNTEKHIWYMKVLYLTFPINSKPEWVSMSDILSFEKQMKETNNN